MADTNGAKAGWSDRELLECLLHIVDVSNVALNLKDDRIRLQPGRNANGFLQKINALKRSLKPDWDSIAASQPANEDTPTKPKDTITKPKTTPRKRKTKTNTETNAEPYGSPKKRGRGRPSKKVEAEAEVEAEANEEIVNDVAGGKDEEMCIEEET